MNPDDSSIEVKIVGYYTSFSSSRLCMIEDEGEHCYLYFSPKHIVYLILKCDAKFRAKSRVIKHSDSCNGHFRDGKNNFYISNLSLISFDSIDFHCKSECFI